MRLLRFLRQSVWRRNKVDPHLAMHVTDEDVYQAGANVKAFLRWRRRAKVDDMRRDILARDLSFDTVPGAAALARVQRHSWPVCATPCVPPCHAIASTSARVPKYTC